MLRKSLLKWSNRSEIWQKPHCCRDACQISDRWYRRYFKASTFCEIWGIASYRLQRIKAKGPRYRITCIYSYSLYNQLHDMRGRLGQYNGSGALCHHVSERNHEEEHHLCAPFLLGGIISNVTTYFNYSQHLNVNNDIKLCFPTPQNNAAYRWFSARLQ